MSNEISFSIITVTYNAKDDLLKTIDSIQNQDYKFFSHLIKDGLSNDNTNKIDFSKYRNTEFHQSKDKGVYDAMNQAFKLSINPFLVSAFKFICVPNCFLNTSNSPSLTI